MCVTLSDGKDINATSRGGHSLITDHPFQNCTCNSLCVSVGFKAQRSCRGKLFTEPSIYFTILIPYLLSEHRDVFDSVIDKMLQWVYSNVHQLM